MKTSELQAIKQRYNIVGNCDALNHVLDVALQVAPTEKPEAIASGFSVGFFPPPVSFPDNLFARSANRCELCGSACRRTASSRPANSRRKNAKGIRSLSLWFEPGELLTVVAGSASRPSAPA